MGVWLGMRARVMTDSWRGYSQYHGHHGTVVGIRYPFRFSPQDDCLTSYVTVRLDCDRILELPEGCVSRIK